jgi:hypothetical protein
MVTEKWFNHHWTNVLLATETGLVAINRLVLVTFSCQLDSWPICNHKFSIAFKLEEWQPNFFGRQQLSTHLISD